MRTTGILAVAVGLSWMASAQTSYPTKPIRLIVPFPPGGPTDVTARVIAEEMSQTIGQQVIIDNRAGAGGNIAAGVAAKSAPDGYTLFFATGGTHGINPSLYAKIPYDPIKDFAPVVWVSTSPNVFVAHPKFPASTMSELIAYAKANPGKVNFATAGNGTTTHMSAELLKALTGIDIVHVPYRGSAPALSDLLAGHIELMVDGLPSSMPHIKAGSIKALGVTTAQRTPSAPNVPAVSETVRGYEAVAWFGLLVPAGTPKQAIEKLNAEANRALRTEKIRKRYAELGAEPHGGTPEEFDKQIRTELKKWADVVKATGARVE
jgi:tripartite-type tricarboxylate transporter receptor subunit TctC